MGFNTCNPAEVITYLPFLDVQRLGRDDGLFTLMYEQERSLSNVVKAIRKNPENIGKFSVRRSKNGLPYECEVSEL